MFSTHPTHSYSCGKLNFRRNVTEAQLHIFEAVYLLRTVEAEYDINHGIKPTLTSILIL